MTSDSGFSSRPPGGPGADWLNARDLGASGSLFETRAETTAGSRRLTVSDPGDFRAGQEVMITRAFARIEGAAALSMRPGIPPARRPLSPELMEIRGYDGSQGSWLVYLIEISPGLSGGFRWSGDRGRTWSSPAPITGEWQLLDGGIEVRFGRTDWGEESHAIWFSARDLLVTRIEEIDGHALILRDAPDQSSGEAVVRHCDSGALQAAIERACSERKNLHLPAGHYRLAKRLLVENPSGLTIEGCNGADAVLDISEGENPVEPWKAACVMLSGGTEATLRNLSLTGHSGFAEADQCGGIMVGSLLIWGFYLKGCSALTVIDTQRVLVENCHARRMATECFYSQGTQEAFIDEGKSVGTTSITYLRCSVEDCARNAFNNNDLAENTSVLQCRIKDVGGCTWEGASRFVRFIGNYVCNAGTVAMGNIGFRQPHLETRGSGQHIVADNVFEGHDLYGGREGGTAIRAYGGATQMIIRDNLFINYKGAGAVELSGQADTRHLTAGNAIVRGNIIDLTSPDGIRVPRTAIRCDMSDVIISENQIYVRDGTDDTVTALRIGDPAVNLNITGNLIRNCGRGIVSARARGVVAGVIDSRTFVQAPHVDNEGAVPLVRRMSHRYRGWNIAWIGPDGQRSFSRIAGFDPETFHFQLEAPAPFSPGQAFEVFPPEANWQIRNNIISDCGEPVRLDSYGSPTSVFAGNIVAAAGGAAETGAVDIRGDFFLSDNRIEEPPASHRP